jgi:hypothetical protein
MLNRMKVVAAMAEVGAAERRAAKIAAAEYPVGKRIAWERGRGIQYGYIENTHFHHGPRFRVRNEWTNKVYWIDFYDVVRAAGQPAVDDYFVRR